MGESIRVVNELLVELYNDILLIEGHSFKQADFNDLTITEVHTIEAIGLEAGKSMSEVASELKITVGTLTTAVNNLVKKGYVERKRSETDRRVVTVVLTHNGRIVYRVHNRFHHEMVRTTINGLNEEEEKVLIQALSKLNVFFKNKLERLLEEK